VDGEMAYPIINYEYAIVSKKQPNAALAKSIRGLLTWAIDPNGGSTGDYLSRVHFVALPDKIRLMSHARIKMITT
jgi:phosphate transport system substrate-binding protein